ncbi:hypothetical protein BGZ50_006854 [Haplosporangium sp. Z 11]|nr:hypothetical protein BGZ50_006854 [Haplosporangium sp. Z 11]
MMKQTKPRAVKASVQKAPALDLSSVCTVAPPENPPTNPPTRIFGLPDAPCYYPTAEEFMEPLRFIESIRPEAEKAGICKIIPPEGWKPAFALDTSVFRFKTRIQKLNSMEGETRTNLNYLDQLYKFHRQQGHPVTKIPQLDKRPIDLFRLKKEVAARGGYQKVTALKRWAEIGRDLDYTRKQCTSLSNALKSTYAKVILPYEIYLSKQAKPPLERSAIDPKREPSTDPLEAEKPESSQPPAIPETRKSKRIKKDPVSYAGKHFHISGLTYGSFKVFAPSLLIHDSASCTSLDSVPSSPSSSDRMSSEPATVKKDDSDVCELCHTDCDLDKMLICDGCELGYHIYCLTPPLQHIPKSDWYCARCLVAGDDFGFEEGEEYSLSSFQQKCNTFKRNWFEKSGLTDGQVTEDIVEREFWRLVENAYETAEVEYGADLHSTQHGSGFASLERHPTDKYAAHPANLNNIPVLPESLFCHIQSDISGMMVPWLYVGMCFSTFCWHNEDHYTYSINYMHWGETKTWYGVPASDALKFEDTMRQTVPELFQQQPDLLFQLVTMLSPERLVANGVKVVALDQRPGQFVVTFPQAYHAGFNHGFNFAEAVNFAPPDWCSFGLDCVQRYKEHRKQPVFSHDELIMTTALNDSSIATAQWLQYELKSLLDRELSHRRIILNQHPTINVVLEKKDRSEEEVQCAHCMSYIYLSQIGCQCTTKVVCHNHFSELCQCDLTNRILRLRYSGEELREIVQSVLDNAAIPDVWAEKYRKIMMETRVPSLKHLRTLLAEADRIPYPIAEAGHLREFVAQANEWVEAVTKMLVRKHHHQGRRQLDRAQCSNGKRLEDLQEMLHQVERLRFDCPEIRLLEDSIKMMQGFREDARRVLSKPEHDLQECRELYETGIAMNIDMDEIDRLELIVKDLAWNERATTKGVLQDDFQLICSLVTDAEKSGVSRSNPLLMDLIRKKDEGQQWEDRAQEVLHQNPVNLTELKAIIEAGSDLTVSRTVLSKAEQLYNKVVDWEKTAEQLVTKSSEPIYGNRPMISELKRALKVADSNPIKVVHKAFFEEESRKFDDWFASCQALFMPPGTKKLVGLELEEALEDLKHNVETCTVDEKAPVPMIFDEFKSGDLKQHKKDDTVGVVSTTELINSAKESRQEDNATMLIATATTPTPAPTSDTFSSGNDPMSGGQNSVTDSATVDKAISKPKHAAKGQGATASDSVMDIDREEQIYCLCRSSEAGMMVECDECHEWYHGTCVRVTKREASAKSNYICPVCNLSLVIRRDIPRPTLDQIVSCANDGHSLRFFSPEVELLSTIASLATEFQKKVERFLQQDSIKEKDVLVVKAYLRKIEGLDIELTKERDALRAHILRLCPSSMPVPGVMLSNYPTAPPRGTISSNCLCCKQDAPVESEEKTSEIMIQCGTCHDWYHTSCVGLDLERTLKLTKFSCPVCCIVRKKSYPLGQGQYHDEVHARASVRIKANKEQADTKKKRRKLSKDESDLAGAATVPEEKKKRPYKRRDPTENGEKPKPRRRKSSGAQSTSSQITTSSAPQALGPATALPSFSESFLLPHDKLPGIQQQRPQQPRTSHANINNS